MGIEMDKSTEKLRAISILAEEISKKRLNIFLGAGSLQEKEIAHI